MYECAECGKQYNIEQEAIDCCNQTIFFDGDFRLPNKIYIKPYFMTRHTCPNVKHGDKEWMVCLKIDEKYPMCNYTYRPR